MGCVDLSCVCVCVCIRPHPIPKLASRSFKTVAEAEVRTATTISHDGFSIAAESRKPITIVLQCFSAKRQLDFQVMFGVMWWSGVFFIFFKNFFSHRSSGKDAKNNLAVLIGLKIVDYCSRLICDVRSLR